MLTPRRRVAGGGASGAPAEARIYRAASITGFDEFQGDDEDCGALVGCGFVIVSSKESCPGASLTFKPGGLRTDA